MDLSRSGVGLSVPVYSSKPRPAPLSTTLDPPPSDHTINAFTPSPWGNSAAGLRLYSSTTPFCCGDTIPHSQSPTSLSRAPPRLLHLAEPIQAVFLDISPSCTFLPLLRAITSNIYPVGYPHRHGGFKAVADADTRPGSISVVSTEVDPRSRTLPANPGWNLVWLTPHGHLKLHHGEFKSKRLAPQIQKSCSIPIHIKRSHIVKGSVLSVELY